MICCINNFADTFILDLCFIQFAAGYEYQNFVGIAKNAQNELCFRKILNHWMKILSCFENLIEEELD